MARPCGPCRRSRPTTLSASSVDRADAAGALLEVSDDERCGRRRHLRPSRRPPARDRAGRGAHPRVPAAPDRRPAHDRFRLLTGGSRTALPRQQTLRAVVDWSYELLFDDEQRVFERLSVFPGGCDLPTAEAVCADDDIAAEDVADISSPRRQVARRRRADAATACATRSSRRSPSTAGSSSPNAATSERIRDAMARHFAELCAQSAAAYTGDGQRAWLMAIDREQDNLRAALEWAVANDDAETAMTIAGGTSWSHWLAGMTMEGKRWLDDAFACGGDADERTRALALTGRGLLDFLAGHPERCDDVPHDRTRDLRPARRPTSMILANTFYAEVAAARNEHEEARRRRRIVIDFYDQAPHDPFSKAARSYSCGKLAVLDGDIIDAEAHYRAAGAGFAQMDRPVMRSMTLDVVAEFDERAGDYAAAVRDARNRRSRPTRNAACAGYTGSLFARLGWALLHQDELERAAVNFERGPTRRDECGTSRC